MFILLGTLGKAHHLAFPYVLLDSVNNLDEKKKMFTNKQTHCAFFNFIYIVKHIWGMLFDIT